MTRLYIPVDSLGCGTFSHLCGSSRFYCVRLWDKMIKPIISEYIMKRILIFLVVGALAIEDALAQKASPSVTATSDAETKPIRYYPPNIIYVHAGYCTSWISSCGLTSSARPGYKVGITDRIRVGRRLPFYLRTGADFISKGYEINGFDSP